MDIETPADLRRPELGPADIRSIFYGIMLAMFLSALDQTIVATALPTIGRELGDLSHLPWVVTAYLLAATAVTPLYGKFSDMHGRRPTMLIAIGIFVAGSIACALAPTIPLLAAGRAIQGLGGGGLIALAQTIIADMVSPRERGRYQVYFGAVFATASVAGPILGGLISQTIGWPWIFWINLPLGFLAFLLVNERLKKLPTHHQRHRLDWAGAAFMVLATLTLMLALTWGGNSYPWLSAPIAGLFAVSAVAWLLFGRRLAVASEPLIPLAVLSNPIVATGTAAGALTMGCYIGLVIIVPIFLETRLGLSARESGLALVPFMLGVPVGATVAGRTMASITHYKRPPTIGLALSVLALAALAATARTAGVATTVSLLGITAVGLGTVFPVATVAVQNAVATHHLGTATASMNFLRQLAGAVIVAGFAAIAFGGGLTLEGLSATHTPEPGAFALVFWAAAGCLAVALAAFLLMEERPLRTGTAPPDPTDAAP